MLDGMIGGHAYVVVGTKTDANGQRWVTVHNAAGDPSKTQTISYEDAQKIFGTSYVGS